MQTESLKPLGGYLPLELDLTGGGVPGNWFNMGHLAFAELLKACNCTQIALPRYVCGSIVGTAKNLSIPIVYYSLDRFLEPVWEEIPDTGLVLYVDYFGLKDRAVEKAAEHLGDRLIADLTQAFFYRPPKGIEGFNSVRKFIGAPDGAFLFSDAVKADRFPRQEIGEEVLCQIVRADGRVEEGYPLFCKANSLREKWETRRISRFSETVLRNTDLDRIARKRREHFERLDRALRGINQIEWGKDNAAPLCYPLLLPNGTEMKKKLISEKIFVPTYWPGIDDLILPGSSEENFVRNLVCLPVDQHLTDGDLDRIIGSVTSLSE